MGVHRAYRDHLQTHINALLQDEQKQRRSWPRSPYVQTHSSPVTNRVTCEVFTYPMTKFSGTGYSL